MIKAIETVYHGYRFRSRLEARYAIFFDMLGIPYEYEKEGYNLYGVWYLPDFWLPEQKRWIEIKGQAPTNEERAKVEALESGTGYPTCIFYGLPGENAGIAFYTCGHEGSGGKSFNDNVHWRQCSTCGVVDVDIRHDDTCSLYSEVREVELDVYSCTCPYQNVQANYETPALEEACTAARQARFEHGGTQ